MHFGSIANIALSGKPDIASFAIIYISYLGHVAEMDLKWLSEQLNRPGFSQAGLARALGKSPSAVNRILSGARQIKLSEAEKITAYLGVSSPPASLEDYQKYHLALGRAVVLWNAIELHSAMLLDAVAPEASTSTKDIFLLLYQAIDSRSQRLSALSAAVGRALQDKRNLLDTWLSLFDAISRAGDRRDTYANVIAIDSHGQVVGEAWDSGAGAGVSIEQLHEDADHFKELARQILKFDDSLRETFGKSRKMAEIAKPVD